MSKYIKKARSIARETSHQIHHVRDDITKKQLQKERDKIPAHARVNNATYKFSDIGKWLDKDLDDEDDDFFSSLNSQTDSGNQEQLKSDTDHPQGSSLQSSSTSLPPPPSSIFDDDLFGDEITSGDPLGLTESKPDDLFPDDKQQEEDLVVKVRETDNTHSQETTLNPMEEEEEREIPNENGDIVKDSTASAFSVVQNTELPMTQELATTNDSMMEENAVGFTDGDKNEEIEECGLLGKYLPNKSDEETQPFHSSSSHNSVTDPDQSNNDDNDDTNIIIIDGVTNGDKSTTATQQDEETLIEDDSLNTSSSTKCEEDDINDELFKSFTTPMAAMKLQQQEEEERSHDDDDDELFKSFSIAEADKLHKETKTSTDPANDTDSKPVEPVVLGTLEMTEDHPLMHLSDDYDDPYSTTATPITIPPPSLTPPLTSLSPSPNSHPPPPLINSSPENTTWSPKGSKRPRPVVPPRPAMTNRYSVESSTAGVFSSDSEANRSLEFIPTKRKRGGLPIVSITSKETMIPPLPPPSPPAGESTMPLSLSLATFCLYLYYTLNPFVYLAGFLAGFLLFYVVFGSAFVLYVQYSEREKERRAASKTSKDRLETLPSLDQLPKTIEVDFEKKRELKSNAFGLVHQYHPSKHHPSQRHITRVRLYDDFHLELHYRKLIHTPHDGPVTRNDTIKKDLRECSILLVPEEVALNRKRRWSKKFPICVQWPDDRKEGHVFLFTSTSREKEEWFRRLRAASENKSYDQLIKDCSAFYRYMGCYMPEGTGQSPLLARARPQSQNIQSTASTRNQRKGRQTHQHHGGATGNNKTGGIGAGSKTESVHFSMSADSEQDDADDSTLAVSITQRNQSTSPASIRSATGTSSLSSQRNGYSRPSSGDQTSILLPLSISIGWINAGMARLAWDLWHEERWKNWVTSRIQRKLIRIKTPSFLEELKVTEVTMGMDMPIIRKPFKLPKLNQNGIWIYLEVTYNGSFTMTIETKLKLGPRGATPESVPLHQFNQFPSLGEGAGYHHHKRIRRHKVGGEGEEEEEEISSGSDEEGEEDEERSSSYSHSTEEKDMESQQQTSAPHPGTTDTTSGPPGRKEKILNNMVSRFQKIAAKSRIVAKAAEKVSSYPLVLTVEVKRLDGLLVINMAPPPSDAIWYGFSENPKLELVATPKLGQREVTLSYVTDWIEKKLCEVVEKKLVLPNMEDLVVPVLSSGLQEDKLVKDKIPS